VEFVADALSNAALSNEYTLGGGALAGLRIEQPHNKATVVATKAELGKRTKCVALIMLFFSWA
jgi:hypothetical protein